MARELTSVWFRVCQETGEAERGLGGGKGELGVTAGSESSPGFGWITEDAAQDSEIKPGNSCGNLDSNHGVTAPPPS